MVGLDLMEKVLGSLIFLDGDTVVDVLFLPQWFKTWLSQRFEGDARKILRFLLSRPMTSFEGVIEMNYPRDLVLSR